MLSFTDGYVLCNHSVAYLVRCTHKANKFISQPSFKKLIQRGDLIIAATKNNYPVHIGNRKESLHDDFLLLDMIH